MGLVEQLGRLMSAADEAFWRLGGASDTERLSTFSADRKRFGVARYDGGSWWAWLDIPLEEAELAASLVQGLGGDFLLVVDYVASGERLDVLGPIRLVGEFDDEWRGKAARALEHLQRRPPSGDPGSPFPFGGSAAAPGGSGGEPFSSASRGTRARAA